MSNKNKRRAGKKKGRDKGVKKKKNETRVQRNVRQNMMQRAWTRIHVYRIDGSLLVSPTTAVRSSSIYDAGPKNARDRIVPLLTSDYSSHVPSYYPLCGRRASSESFL